MGLLRLALTWVLLSAVARTASAEWRVVAETNELSTSGAATHRHVELEEAATAQHATVELALFSTKNATLRVVDDANASSSLADVVQRDCIAGVNGGYFDPNYAPVGLLITGGKVVSPLSKAKLLSAVVSVANGRLQIQRAAQFSMKSKPTTARQCGPFLVENGKPIASLNNTRAARRTFVASGVSDRAAIGYSSHVTLAELASILATPTLAAEFKLNRAMNLDGGSSSAFWFAGENGAFSIHEQKTVRDYLAIVPK